MTSVVVVSCSFVILLQALSFVEGVPRIFNALGEEYENGSDVVTSTGNGALFELTCVGEGQLHWTNNSVDPDFSKRVSISSNSTSSTLRVVYAFYYDTGYFNCTDNTDTAFIYVYFKDSNNLLVVDPNETMISMSVNAYETVILPCRPTSPDVNVTLETHLHPDITDNLPFYNPRIGFMMIFKSIHDSQIYECRATTPEGSESTLLIHVIVQIAVSDKPILPPTIRVTPSDYVVVGDNLTLSCTSQVISGRIFKVTWSVPNERKDQLVGNQTKVKEIPPYRVYIKNITIVNATKEDSGNYTCLVQAAYNKNSRSVYVEVHDLKPFLQLTTETTVHRVAAFKHEPVRWIVKIKSFPRDVVAEWRKDGVDTLVTSDRYNITTDSSKTVLQIYEPTVEDSGNYTLNVSNDGTYQTMTLTLTVYDVPYLRLDGQPYYTVNKPVNISCFATGLPLPRINWYYRPCSYLNGFDCSHRNFKKIQAKFSNISEVRLGSYSLESIITWPMMEAVELLCNATNRYGGKNDTLQVRVTDLPKEFMISGPKLILEGDTSNFTCAASIYSYTGNLNWFIQQDGSDEMIIQNTSDTLLSVGSSRYSFWSSLIIKDIQRNHSGLYICKAEKRDNSISTASIVVQVLSEKFPKFDERTNINNSNIIISNAKPMTWYCLVSGVPPPSVTWLKDGKPLDLTQSLFSLSDDNQTLTMLSFSVFDEGKYECVASNKAGSDKRFVQLYLAGSEKMKWYIIAIVVVAALLIIVVTILIWKVRQYQNEKEELRQIGLLYFNEGAVDSINPDLPLDEQTELLPYHVKWEFPRSKLKLGKQLGAGAFGVVMIAEAKGIVENEDVTTVAVKMVQRHADTAHIKALASELKILVHLGKHLNVVNLLGACTQNVAKRELFVIVEYCRFGNIHDYLLKNREQFIDQIVDEDTIDVNITAPIGNRSSVTSDPSSAISSLNTETSLISYIPTENHNTEPNGYISTFNVLYRNNPVNGDTKEQPAPVLSTSTLLCWSFQVARGMEYLASRRVLHGDLAARNILLTDNNVVKICDFGLAKSIYHDEAYKKQGDGPLPLKWMAIESIRDRLFTTQSDVWSFGIVLWEIFSLARTPYPDLPRFENILNKLVNGYRMEKPNYATDTLYKVMLDCWDLEPSNRPSFTQLADALGKMMENNVREHYIELNESFETLRDSGGEDYLSMVSPPSYKPSLPHYVNVPNNKKTDDDSYLDMKPSWSSVRTKEIEESAELKPMLGNVSPPPGDILFEPYNDDYLIPRQLPATNDAVMNPSYTLASRLGNNYGHILRQDETSIH